VVVESILDDSNYNWYFSLKKESKSALKSVSSHLDPTIIDLLNVWECEDRHPYIKNIFQSQFVITFIN